MSFIEIKGLSKIYGNGMNTVTALNNIDLQIEEGELIAITGTSGSGKSSLLHILGGIDMPDEGTVLIENEDIFQMKPSCRETYMRENVSIIFQFFNLIPILNIRENIELPLLLNKKDRGDIVDRMIEELQLEERVTHFPSQLSGGQQQRVAIARAMAMGSKIILADEPTGNLDQKNGKVVIELMKAMSKKYNQTIIVVTHDIDIANECDRIIKLKDGILN